MGVLSCNISCTSREVWAWDQLYGHSVMPWRWSPSKISGHGAWSELLCLQVLTAGTSVLEAQSCPWHPGKRRPKFHVSHFLWLCPICLFLGSFLSIYFKKLQSPGYIPSEVSQTENTNAYDITNMWDIKKWYKWTYLQTGREPQCRK